MKTNMGFIDKSVRILIAVAIIALYFTRVLTGTAALILFLLAGFFLLTSFIGFCPLYTLLGISTKSRKTISPK